MDGLFTFFVIAALLVNLILAVKVSDIATLRGQSASSFGWLAFLFSAPIALLFLLAIPIPKSVSQASGSTEAELLEAQCPKCKETIRSDAEICRYCRSHVEPTYETKLSALRDQQEADRLERIAAEELDLKIAKEKSAARKRRLKTWRPVIIIVGSLVIIGVAVSIALPAINTAQAQQAAEKQRQEELALISSAIPTALDNCLQETQIESIEGSKFIVADGASIVVAPGDFGEKTPAVQRCLVSSVEPSNGEKILKATVGANEVLLTPHPRSASTEFFSYDVTPRIGGYTLTIQKISK